MKLVAIHRPIVNHSVSYEGSVRSEYVGAEMDEVVDMIATAKNVDRSTVSEVLDAGHSVYVSDDKTSTEYRYAN